MKHHVLRSGPTRRLAAIILCVTIGFMTGWILPVLLLLFIITAAGVIVSWGEPESTSGRTEFSWVSVFTVAATTLAMVGGARIWHEQNDYTIRSNLYSIQENFVLDHPINDAQNRGSTEMLQPMLTQIRDDASTFVRAHATVYSLRRLGHRDPWSEAFFHGIESRREGDRNNDLANVTSVRNRARVRARAMLNNLWENIREDCAPGSSHSQELASTLLWLSGIELILAQASEENGNEIGSADKVAKWEAICEANVE